MLSRDMFTILNSIIFFRTFFQTYPQCQQQTLFLMPRFKLTIGIATTHAFYFIFHYHPILLERMKSVGGMNLLSSNQILAELGNHFLVRRQCFVIQYYCITTFATPFSVSGGAVEPKETMFFDTTAPPDRPT